jgi:sulfate permease, SulP family
MKPYLLGSLQNYTRANLLADAGAGVAVGLVALPLAMAIAIASGVKPENGLITAVIGGFIVSALGGSRVQIGGPAAAFIGLVYATVQQFGINGLLIALMLSGAILFIMGVLKLGSYVRFVPNAVITGFTNGIALLIVVAQINSFLGLAVGKLPSGAFNQLQVLAGALPTVNLTTLALGVISLVLLVKWPKSLQARTKVPATVGVLVIGSLIAPLVSLCGGEKIATIGSEFGGLGASLLMPHLPNFQGISIGALLLPAISLAMLGAIESLLCARIADDLYNKEINRDSGEVEQHDPNQELIAQGAANLIVPLFSGIATTGTIARTITNIKSGAASPVAGIVHSITLLVIMIAAASLASYIPMTVLAAILLWVSWNMLDVRYHFSASPIHQVTATITLFLTLTWGIAAAVGSGMLTYWLLNQAASRSSQKNTV